MIKRGCQEESAPYNATSLTRERFNRNENEVSKVN